MSGSNRLPDNQCPIPLENWREPLVKIGRRFSPLERRQNRETAKLRELVAGLRPPSNTSVIAFGSLARKEWTSGSDVDWTLMIDGPADMDHLRKL